MGMAVAVGAFLVLAGLVVWLRLSKAFRVRAAKARADELVAEGLRLRGLTPFQGCAADEDDEDDEDDLAAAA